MPNEYHRNRERTGSDSAQCCFDLTKVMALNSHATFAFNGEGDSVKGVGVWHGHKLVCRCIGSKHGLIVLASVDEEFTVKRLERRPGPTWFVVANQTF